MIDRRTLLAACAAAALPLHVRAADWPQRPIRFIVPGLPAAPSDVAIRSLEDVLSAKLGQSIVVENKPGGQGVIGVDAVAKAAPDGYTFGLINLQLASAVSLRAKMPFDLLKDLEPVVQLSTESPVLLVKESLPVKSLKELIAYAKARPGELVYGTGGAGSPAHLGMELLQRTVGIRFLHVPYRSIPMAVTDLAGGQLDLALAGSAAAQKGLQTGRVRALAISSPKPSPVFPGVPTLAEAGFADVDLRGWVGIAAPTGSDAAIIKRLNDEVNRALDDPKVQERFAATGSEPAGGTPAEFKAFVAREVARWGKVIKDAGITLQ